MTRKIRRRRAVLALLVAVSLILLTAYFGESPNSPLHSVQRGVAAVLAPVQDGASKVLSPVRDIAGFISSTIDAKSQNAQLRRENAQLRLQVGQYQYYATQAQQLARQQGLDAANSINDYSPLSASVIGKDPVLWYDYIELSAGSSDGVREFDPVIGDGGLVGYISEVGGDYSIVTLVTSPKFAASATVIHSASTSYTGLLQPKVGNPDELLLSSLPSSATITSGDTVVTSGFKDPGDAAIESLYPPGIPIGTVSTPSTGIADMLVNSQQVAVAPVVDLQHLSSVQVLTRPHPHSQSASLP